MPTLDATDQVQNVLSRFDDVRPRRRGWVARCPCPGHNGDGDQNPSLAIGLGHDGRLLVNCRVGCPIDEVLEAVGLEPRDLFPTDGVASLGDRPEPSPATTCVDIEMLNRAYGLVLAALDLSDAHRGNLRERGLTDAEIARRHYRSLRNLDRGAAARAAHRELGDAVFAVPGFLRGEHGATLVGDATGLVVPVRDLDGRVQALKIRRAAGEPRYLYLCGGDGETSCGSPVHVPLGTLPQAPVVRVTEGELKADVCAALDGTPTLGVPGVSGWPAALPLLERMGARTVILSFDAPDVRSSEPVRRQARAFYESLIAKGLAVEVEDWE